MILKDYPLKAEIVEALTKYERDTSLSINVIVENFLEQLLYENGYLTVEIDKEDIQTPMDIHSNNKKTFVKNKWKDNVQIKKGNLNFGSVKLEIADEVIDKLAGYNDGELENLSKTNWQYPKKYYTPFLLAKLKDESITPESFMKSISFITSRTRENHGALGTDVLFNQRLIGRFDHNKYSQDQIEKVISFLSKFTEKDLDWLIDKRKKSKEQSGAYVIKYMKSVNERR